ncbi:hypothetical protein DFH11DRAFT_1879235, partial [Phellopilus nigrolimitatus]
MPQMTACGSTSSRSRPRSSCSSPRPACKSSGYFPASPLETDNSNDSKLTTLTSLTTTAMAATAGERKRKEAERRHHPHFDCLEAWKGFFASVRPVYKDLIVNITVCMGIVYVARLSNAMIKYQQTLYGTSKPQSFYRCAWQCTEFIIHLQHADDLPVVNVGTRPRKSLFPPSSARSSWASNTQGIKVLGLREGAPFIQGFGIECSLDMAVVPSHLHSSLKVICSSGSLIVTNGYWDTRDVHFHRAALLTRATILVLANGGHENFGDSSVVASCDEEFMRYPASLGLQEHSKEASFITLLFLSLQKYIIVLRGGVSDDQFDQ